MRSNKLWLAMVWGGATWLMLGGFGDFLLVSAEEVGEKRPPIRTLADVTWEFVAADRAPEPGSLAERLGQGVDVAEEFVRLKPEAMNASELLTERSRALDDDSEAGRKLAHVAELRKTNWYSQIVDMRFAGEPLAAALVVFVPRPTQGAKQVEVVYLIRHGDQWQVTFAPEADAVAELGADAQPVFDALAESSEKRRAELLRVVSKPLDKPLDFHGAWTTHYRTSFVYLTFQENGEVFMLQTHGNGTASYGVHDYHLSGDEIVIEDGSYPIRLKHDDGSYWEQDGQRYYGLVTPDAKRWFPDRTATEPLYLTPIYKGDWPVRRPVVPGG